MTNMKLQLDGVALVTAAAGGIGRAVALQFVHDGCTSLVLSDLKAADLHETVAMALAVNANASVKAYPGDVTSEDFVKDLVGFVLQVFGRLDYVSNGVGTTGVPGPTHEMETASYDQVLDINTKSLWVCEREEIRSMMAQEPLDTSFGPARGAIVNVSSVMGILALPDCAPYIISKHGENSVITIELERAKFLLID
ncbi:uncharacterized protein PV06_11804 [Exophiala oligosperma]|uniref:Uncharacterized protein n=1 Tax=Exophiala oligosperma TaxID=215243 RepID=A0A0D2DJG6_9EURO|nr:uncharacterized protein PV06_11804 [Exophiala oligosperma]KIW35869.1 hypothetical protein PV06_11804 [Exophiala oligosperma]